MKTILAFLMLALVVSCSTSGRSDAFTVIDVDAHYATLRHPSGIVYHTQCAFTAYRDPVLKVREIEYFCGDLTTGMTLRLDYDRDDGHHLVRETANTFTALYVCDGLDPASACPAEAFLTSRQRAIAPVRGANFPEPYKDMLVQDTDQCVTRSLNLNSEADIEAVIQSCETKWKDRWVMQ